MEDNRKVTLLFDNKNFNKKVEETKSGLQKLDQALSFDKTIDSSNSKLTSFFDRLSQKIHGVNLNPISDSVNSVSNSFSKLDVVVTGIFFRLGQQIEEFGAKMVKHLTIDQVTAGFSKYEQILKSTQTILATDPELSQDKVNEYLDQLIWYTDETSYAMTDMVSNISTFTNMGIPLDNAVQDMMGIGNAAAMAGASVDQASHAMVGFSRAMGQGFMTAGVWNSWIKTANIGTMEFKKRAIEAAKEMGILYEANGKLYSKYDTQKTPTEVTAENFAASLTSGKWFTKDVMEKVLQDYSKSINEIYKIYEDNEGKMSTSEILEKYGDQLDAFSTKAFMLGQEATTFTQAISSLFDAMSSRWMEVWTLIFGDYEEARKMWTELANWLYDTFVTPMDYILDVIDKWSSTVISVAYDEETGIERQITAHDALIDSFRNILEVITQVSRILTEVFSNIFGSIQYGDNFLSKRLVEYTKKFLEFTKSLSLFDETGEKLTENGKKLKDTFTDFFAIFGIISDFIKHIISEIRTVFAVIKESSDFSILDTLHNIFDKLHWDVFIKLYSIVPKVKTVIDKMSLSIASFVKNVWPFVKNIGSNLISIGGSLIKILGKILSPLGSIIGNLAGAASKGSYTFLSFISNLTESLAKFFKELSNSKLLNSFVAFFNNLGNNVDFSGLLGALKQLLNLDVVNHILTTLLNLLNEIFSLDFSSINLDLKELNSAYDKASGIPEKSSKGFTGIQKIVSNIVKIILNSIHIILYEVRNSLDVLLPLIEDISKKVLASFIELASYLIELIGSSGILNSISNLILDTIDNIIINILGKIKTYIPEIAKIIDLIFDAIETVVRNRFKAINNLILSTITGVFRAIPNMMIDIAKGINIDLGALLKMPIVIETIEVLTKFVKKVPVKKFNAFANAIMSLVTAIQILAELPVNVVKSNVNMIILLVGKITKALAGLSALSAVTTYGGSIAVLASSKESKAGGLKNTKKIAKSYAQTFAPILMIVALAEGIKIMAKAMKVLSEIDVDSLDASFDMVIKIMSVLEKSFIKLFVIYGLFSILSGLFSRGGMLKSGDTNIKNYKLIDLGLNLSQNPLAQFIKQITTFFGVLSVSLIALLYVVKNIMSFDNGEKILNQGIKVFSILMGAMVVFIGAMAGLLILVISKTKMFNVAEMFSLIKLFKIMIHGISLMLASMALLVFALNGKNVSPAKISMAFLSIISVMLMLKSILKEVTRSVLMLSVDKRIDAKLLIFSGMLKKLTVGLSLIMASIALIIFMVNGSNISVPKLGITLALIVATFGMLILIIKEITKDVNLMMLDDHVVRKLNAYSKMLFKLTTGLSIMMSSIALIIFMVNGSNISVSKLVVALALIVATLGMFILILKEINKFIVSMSFDDHISRKLNAYSKMLFKLTTGLSIMMAAIALIIFTVNGANISVSKLGMTLVLIVATFGMFILILKEISKNINLMMLDEHAVRKINAYSKMLFKLTTGLSIMMAAIALIIFTVNGANVSVSKLGMTLVLIVATFGMFILILKEIEKSIMTFSIDEGITRKLNTFSRMIFNLALSLAIVFASISLVIFMVNGNNISEAKLGITLGIVSITMFLLKVLLTSITKSVLSMTANEGVTRKLNTFSMMIFNLALSLAIVFASISLIIYATGSSSISASSLGMIAVIILIVFAALKTMLKSINKLSKTMSSAKSINTVSNNLMKIAISLAIVFAAIALIMHVSKNVDFVTFVGIGILLIGIVGILLGIFKSLNKMNNRKNSAKNIMGFIAVVAAFAILAVVLTELSVKAKNVPIKFMLTYFASLIVLILIFVGLSKLISKTVIDIKKILTICLAFILLSNAIKQVSEVLIDLSVAISKNSDFAKAAIGLGIIFAVFVVFVGIAIALSKIQFDVIPILAVCASFLLIAESLSLICMAIGKLASIATGEGFKKAAEALGIIFGIITALFVIMGVLSGAGIGFVVSAGILLFAAAFLVMGVALISVAAAAYIFVKAFDLFIDVIERFSKEKDKVEEGIDSLIKLLPKFKIIIAGLIEAVVGGVIVGFINAASDIGVALGDMIVTALEWVADNMDRIFKALDKIWKSIKDHVKKKVKEMFGATEGESGKDLINEFFDGIKIALRDNILKLMKSSDWLSQKIGNLLNKIFKVASPSKLTIYIGRMLAKGLSKGIGDTKEQNGILSSITGLKDKISGSMGNGVDLTDLISGDGSFTDKIQGMLGDMDFSSTLNLNPVVDMDALSNGLNADSLLNTDALSNLNGSSLMGNGIGMDTATAFGEMQNTSGVNIGTENVYNTTNYTQNNYSPEPIDSVEVYRQTNNQLKFGASYPNAYKDQNGRVYVHGPNSRTYIKGYTKIGSPILGYDKSKSYNYGEYKGEYK